MELSKITCGNQIRSIRIVSILVFKYNRVDERGVGRRGAVVKKKYRKKDKLTVLFKQSYKVIKFLGGANQTTV